MQHAAYVPSLRCTLCPHNFLHIITANECLRSPNSPICRPQPLFLRVGSLYIPRTSEIIWCLSSSSWVVSLSIRPAWLFCVVANDRVSLLCTPNNFCCIHVCVYVCTMPVRVCDHHIFFIYLFSDGHWNCFHVLATVDTDHGVQISLPDTDFISFSHVSRSGIAGS